MQQKSQRNTLNLQKKSLTQIPKNKIKQVQTLIIFEP
jgi:hypothetical protein